MCDCTSCTYTDSFAGWGLNADKGGFTNWPRGESKGPRQSAAEYASHAAHVWAGVAKHVPFTPGQAPQYPAWTRGNGPIQPAPKWLHDWINRKEASPARAEPASPAKPCKAPQHFPELNRQRETSATIYEMAKEKAKRPVGRPPLEGCKRILVSLDKPSIERARALGGTVSAGIRKALARRQSG